MIGEVRTVYVALAFRDGRLETNHGEDLAEIRCWAGTMAQIGWKVFGAAKHPDGSRSLIDFEESADA